MWVCTGSVLPRACVSRCAVRLSFQFYEHIFFISFNLYITWMVSGDCGNSSGNSSDGRNIRWLRWQWHAHTIYSSTERTSESASERMRTNDIRSVAPFSLYLVIQNLKRYSTWFHVLIALFSLFRFVCASVCECVFIISDTVWMACCFSCSISSLTPPTHSLRQQNNFSAFFFLSFSRALMIRWNWANNIDNIKWNTDKQ